MISNFSHRHVDKPEKMEDPSADIGKLTNTLNQFRIINFLFSGSRKLIKKYIVPLMEPNRPQPYTFLDIGAGGCHNAVWLASYCRKKLISVRITCLDNDPQVVEYAKRRVCDVGGVDTENRSAFELSSLPDYDFIFANHFIHHFPDIEIVKLLNLADEKSRIGFLINDLKRQKRMYLLFKLFSLFFLHSSFVSYDGGVSILKGFTLPEMREIISRTENPHRMKAAETFPGRIYIVGRNKK